jgi:hypothetical protein
LARSAFFAKDSIVDPIDGTAGPPEDSKVELDAQFVSDGDNVGYRRTGKQWSSRERKFVPWGQYAVTNGKESKSLTIQEGWPPLGYLHGDAAFFEAFTLDVMPILTAYRRMEKCCGEHGFVPADWSVSSEEVDANKLRCLILKKSGGRSNSFMSLAMDHDFLMSRCWIADGGRTLLELDVDHKLSENDGWQIAGWRHKSFNQDGIAEQTSDAKVIELRVNVPTPADNFELQFPEGAEVHDRLNKTHYTVGKDGAKTGLIEVPDPRRH